MRKAILVGLVIVAVMGLVLASNGIAKGKQGQAGKSNIGHLYLDPVGSDADAWGKITYNLSGDTLYFVMNAHKLVPGVKYVLKSEGVVLGKGVADEYGDLHIKGSVDGSLLDGDGYFNLRKNSNNNLILKTAMTTDFVYMP